MPEYPSSLLGQIQANTTGGVVNRYPPKLGHIGDVDGTPPLNGQVLQHDTARGLWVPSTITAADLDDFNLAGLTTDDMLIWNGTDFVRSPPAAAVSVGTANSAGTADTWSRSDHVHANANLDSLTDVVIAAPATGELIRYNGTNWVDDRAALDDLSDVTITSATTEDELRWNGSAWVNDQAWTAYSPAWTGSVTNPTIGNGSITGAYRRRGDTVTMRVEILIGSTTTFGSGDYFISLPLSASTSYSQIVPLYGLDSGTTNYVALLLFGRAITDGAKGKWIFDQVAAPGSPTSPFTWANNDVVVVTGSYETNA